MSNHSNNVNLHVFIIDKRMVDKSALIDVFDLDSDFMENEEYFREDTLELGYQNESERCADEVYKAHKDIVDPVERLEKMLEDVPEYSNGEQTFIIGNSNHSGDYKFEVTDAGEKIVLSIAFVG